MMYKCLVLLTVLAVQQTVASTTSDSDGDNGGSECVSQQELAAVKADMQGRVDTLQSQLNYWQNVTINILKDLYFSSNSGNCKAGDITLELGVLNNITETNKETNKQLEGLKNAVQQLQYTVDQLQEHCGDCEEGDTTLELSVLKNINETKEANERLDRLQDSVEWLKEQLQGEDQQCYSATTGSFHNPAHNCSHIAYNNLNATSGYYWLQSDPGYAVQVYCDMERVCGCDEGRRGRGGWMRVADIDMTRHKENCPTGFREVTSAGKKMCGGRGTSCVSTSFSSYGVEYSRVCGRIIGYQFGKTNGFLGYHSHQMSIDSYFLDGIVLTYGSPRCHIWSFVAGFNHYISDAHGCPCNSGSFSGTIPPYVQNDYFCDSGHRYSTHPSYIYYINDPLWDGAGCVQGSCCQFNSPPWFCKDLPHPTSEDIELRLCLSESTSNEDVAFEVVEIYTQ